MYLHAYFFFLGHRLHGLHGLVHVYDTKSVLIRVIYA